MNNVPNNRYNIYIYIIMSEEVVNRYVKMALSDKDVLKLVRGRANLILYPEMHKYSTIDEVLGPYGSCLILYESEPNYGHWTCVNKILSDTIEYFNSYGGLPDNALKYIPQSFQKVSNQDYTYLAKLMYDSKYKLTYNEHRFQKMNNDIRTCGRWACLRIILKHLSLKEFTKIFKNKDSDKLATLLTMYINK